jgi:hypothetical protein
LSCIYALHKVVGALGFSKQHFQSGGQCCGSIVPFRPGGAERSVFDPASTLDVMEEHHDLRKFITELTR